MRSRTIGASNSEFVGLDIPNGLPKYPAPNTARDSKIS